MSCHSQHGPQTYLKFIEEATGERITQSDWHAIRQLAATEAGGKLSRAVADPDDSHDAAMELAACINYEQGITFGLDGDGDRVEDYRADELVKAVASVKNTTGTIAAINYIAAHGVKETLTRARGTNDAPLVYSGDPFAPKPDDGSPKGLPYLRQEMTQVEADQMVDWLAKQPLDDLQERRIASHVRQAKATSEGDDEAVLSEQVEMDMLADAISRQTAGTPRAGLHSDIHGSLMHKRRFESLGMTGTEAAAAAAHEVEIVNRESEGIYSHFLSQGMSESEARREAIHYMTKRDRDEYEAALNDRD